MDGAGDGSRRGALLLATMGAAGVVRVGSAPASIDRCRWLIKRESSFRLTLDQRRQT